MFQNYKRGSHSQVGESPRLREIEGEREGEREREGGERGRERERDWVEGRPLSHTQNIH